MRNDGMLVLVVFMLAIIGMGWAMAGVVTSLLAALAASVR